MDERVIYRWNTTDLITRSESILPRWILFLLSTYKLGNIRQRPQPGKSVAEQEDILLTSRHSPSAQDPSALQLLLQSSA